MKKLLSLSTFWSNTRSVSLVKYARQCSSSASGVRSVEPVQVAVKVGVNSFCRRSHNCGELRLANAGELVELYGWLEFNRYNRFLVIRDSYGLVQATIPESKVEEFKNVVASLHRESVVQVCGIVLDRGSNRNKSMPTGDIEVEVAQLNIINCAPDALPVFFGDNESHEHSRLMYRYLDLRSTKMQHNLRLRSNIVHAMRRFLVERCQFVDVETPTLSQWTPGGAAEFIVPAAEPNRGQFYTLPQSPQIYKQLLMCGGIDRYFQVAKCYRNEGAKSDRQPEFTQIDLEMSFVMQDDVIDLVEALIIESWPNSLADYKPTVPFRRVTYDEVMKVYGNDKPDLRADSGKGRPFEFLWVVDFPLFTSNDDSKNERLESTHHPFTAPVEEDLEDLHAGRNLADIRAQHYDLVLNGVELGGGSIRIHDASLQRHVLENILHLPTDTLNHFIKALKYGAPPHGGFALGLDRYVALLAEVSYRLLLGKSTVCKKTNKSEKPVVTKSKNLGEANEFVTSIRDVIAFPKSKNGRCLMMAAPSQLPEATYCEYGITVAMKDDDNSDK